MMARWLVIVVHLTATGCSSPGWTVSPGGMPGAAGVAELHQVAGDRCDLLAEVAGLAFGTAEGKGQEYQAPGAGDRGTVPDGWCRRVADSAVASGRPRTGRDGGQAAVQPAALTYSTA
jgi:hypothetical protein